MNLLPAVMLAAESEKEGMVAIGPPVELIHLRVRAVGARPGFPRALNFALRLGHANAFFGAELVAVLPRIEGVCRWALVELSRARLVDEALAVNDSNACA